MLDKSKRIDWVMVPTQLAPFDPAMTSWVYTLTNGLEYETGVILDTTIQDAFWMLWNMCFDKPGCWVGSLSDSDTGSAWAGHVTSN